MDVANLGPRCAGEQLRQLATLERGARLQLRHRVAENYGIVSCHCGVFLAHYVGLCARRCSEQSKERLMLRLEEDLGIVAD